jgi:hypothetical protein
MKKLSFLCLPAVVLITWTGIGIAQQGKVPAKLPKVRAEVWQKAQAEGVVGVIVGLDVPWQLEGKLSKQAGNCCGTG